MSKLSDFLFGNSKDKARKAGPHTGTGDSGTMGAKPKVVLRDKSGKVIKPKKQ